ncbi:hypothetical protein BJ994_001278 [Arthrobacter pigmenti]|uniref:Uncharacterized protein n=1 Tax=Arthrobacter pigmenti TaxID=271432 RepID=A0A846RNK5_9MICC|nr:hypothetical protein [Arthrobacter pigmenti]NJC22202.1 hypothetical protein [Arthrobacter pigmenti]
MDLTVGQSQPTAQRIVASRAVKIQHDDDDRRPPASLPPEVTPAVGLGG